MNRIRSCTCVLAFTAISIAASKAPGAEVAGMDILIDGKHVAGYAMTYGGESEKERWLLLKRTPLTLERGFQVPVDEQRPNRATLRGKIKLQVSRRNRPGASVTTAHLALERRKGRWYVADPEVDRTLKAAGLLQGATMRDASSRRAD